MAELIWTEPAIQDLDAVADYIALDNPAAARRYVREIFANRRFAFNPSMEMDARSGE